jgi:glycosyltransferase involved in cell wall biosynthesis
MISVLYADRPSGQDGIRDYSEGLAAALDALDGVDAQLVLWSPTTPWPAVLNRSSSIVLQYNPFSYGRGGFAPALLAHLLRRRKQAALCLMVHEPYVAMTNARTAAMGLWQRAQLRMLLEAADAVGISTGGFRSYLPPRQRARAVHMPVGSPLPDARDRRPQTRAMLGVGDADLVVALYGSSNYSRMIEHGVAAIAGIADAGWAPVVLNLGFDAPTLPAEAVPARVIRPGALSSAALAEHLAAADIALLPFVDGASTRRTTMIAALQQQTCVLSTRGHLTDAELAAAPAPILTAADDRAAFVRAAIALADDATLRGRSAAQGRALFERLFSWPVIARRVVGALPPARF